MEVCSCKLFDTYYTVCYHKHNIERQGFYLISNLVLFYVQISKRTFPSLLCLFFLIEVGKLSDIA